MSAMDNDTIWVIGAGALMLITVAFAFIAVMVDPPKHRPEPPSHQEQHKGVSHYLGDCDEACPVEHRA